MADVRSRAVDIHGRCANLAVRVAELSNLQDGAGGLALGQVVPGVRPVGAPVHKQVVARGPEQQVVRLGLSQGLRQKRVVVRLTVAKSLCKALSHWHLTSSSQWCRLAASSCPPSACMPRVRAAAMQAYALSPGHTHVSWQLESSI